MNWKGPFLGFKLDNSHSSDFKIVRINTGDRGEKPLSPSFKDTTMEIPGRDGIIYNSTQIQQLTLSINFAYDDLTQDDLRKLTEWLRPDRIVTLVLDEEPYKRYTGKLSTAAKLSYISFDKIINNETVRIYKGEGNFSFNAFSPWGKAPHWNLTSYSSDDYMTRNEWQQSSGIAIMSSAVESSLHYGSTIRVYNPGDISSPLNLTCTAPSSNYLLIQYNDPQNNIHRMAISLDSSLVGTQININGNTKIITSTSSNSIVTNINNHLLAGDFISIMPSITHYSQINESTDIPEKLICNTSCSIDYAYLYR